MNSDPLSFSVLQNPKRTQGSTHGHVQPHPEPLSYGSSRACTTLAGSGPSPAVSNFLVPGKVSNLHQAAFHAMMVGLPLNRFVTIHWERGGLTDRFHVATGRFLKLAQDWLRVRGHQTAFVWVRENGEPAGEHVHILLHVPPAMARDFSHRQRGWLKACGVGRYRKGVIRSKSVGRSYRHAVVGVQAGECYAGQLARVLGYILKTADAETRRRLGIKYVESSSRMEGKRAGTSQNLGRAARERALSSAHVEPARNCSRKHCLQWLDLRRSTDIRCREHPCSKLNGQDFVAPGSAFMR